MTDEEMVYYLEHADTTVGQKNKTKTAEAIEKALKIIATQPKRGHWLDKKTTIKGGHGLAYGRYGCSVCKKKQPSKTDFCPNCGADMREVNADEEGSESE